MVYAGRHLRGAERNSQETPSNLREMPKDNNGLLPSDRDGSPRDRNAYYPNRYPSRDVSRENHAPPTRIAGERRSKKTYKKD